MKRLHQAASSGLSVDPTLTQFRLLPKKQRGVILEGSRPSTGLPSH